MNSHVEKNAGNDVPLPAVRVGCPVLVPNEVLCREPAESPVDVELDQLLDDLVGLAGLRGLGPPRRLRPADEVRGLLPEHLLQGLRARAAVVELDEHPVVEVVLRALLRRHASFLSFLMGC